MNWFHFGVFLFSLLVVGDNASLQHAGNLHDALCKLHSKGRFHTFLQVLKGTGTDLELQSYQQLTILAPNDHAFALYDSFLEALSEEQLVQVLRNHIVPAYYSRKRLRALNASVPTLYGQVHVSMLEFDTGSKFPKAVYVDTVYARAPVGVHQIDHVLIPQSLQFTPPTAPVHSPMVSPVPADSVVSPAKSPAPVASVVSPAKSPAPVVSVVSPAKSPASPAVSVVSPAKSPVSQVVSSPPPQEVPAAPSPNSQALPTEPGTPATSPSVPSPPSAASRALGSARLATLVSTLVLLALFFY